jgi:hypothetical protein
MRRRREEKSWVGLGWERIKQSAQLSQVPIWLSLKGAIYEEVALFGAVIMMMGLWIANQFEGNPWPVYLSVLFSGLSCVVLRVLIYEKGWGYASFLPKKSLA